MDIVANLQIKNSIAMSKINFNDNINIKKLFPQLKIAIAIAIDIEILCLLCSQIASNGFLLFL
jgi:hypothetical protein